MNSKEMVKSALAKSTMNDADFVKSAQYKQLVKMACFMKSSFLKDIGSFFSSFLGEGKAMAPAAAILSGGAGYLTGRALGKIREPKGTDLSNLQKAELVSEYDSAIQVLRDRIDAKRFKTDYK